MKKLLAVILLSIILVSSCDWFKKNSPSEPEALSPVPLQIGNKWIYNTDLVLEIESQYSIDNQPAYRVAYYFNTVPDTRIYYYWQWDDPYFKEYDNYFTPIASFKFPGELNEITEWGQYRTKLIESNSTVGNFNQCYKYELDKIATDDVYYSTIKSDIGFVQKSNCGSLTAYILK